MCGTKRLGSLSSPLGSSWENAVNTQVEGACAFAWRNYLLLHTGVSENDDRRAALSRYVTSVGEADDCDFDVLQVAGVVYLKKLDEMFEERDARLATDEVLARWFGKNTRPERSEQYGRKY
jgi:hypothetical protein